MDIFHNHQKLRRDKKGGRVLKAKEKSMIPKKIINKKIITITKL